MASTIPVANQSSTIPDWQATVQTLLEQVKVWCAEKNWTVEAFTVSINEYEAGEYEVPALTIFAGKGRIHFEPISRFPFGAEGRVDVLVWPALYRVSLLHYAKHNPPHEWTITLDNGIDWPGAWSKETFYELVEILLRRA